MKFASDRPCANPEATARKLNRPRCLRGPFRVLVYCTIFGGWAEDAPTVAELDGN
jgi:hypothetical protein